MVHVRKGFADPELEKAFSRAERQAMIPTVRLYGALASVLMLLYALVDPFFFTYEDEVRFTLLLLPTLALLGVYIGLTFLPDYPERPLIDWLCLLALGVLVLGENAVLWDEATTFAGVRHASVAINTSLVTVFAAIVMSDRVRWFALWLALHSAAFAVFLVLAGATLTEQVFAGLGYLTGAAIALFIAWSLGRAHRIEFALRRALEAERAKTEELLYNVLPEAAARRLKAGQIVADAYSDASVVFIDVVGFTKLSAKVSPGHLIEMLNAFFNLSDQCAAAHGVEKVKTIGDAYLAVAGGNVPAANSADAAIAFSEGVIAGMADLREATGLPIQVRIGIHSGPVVGGVIGASRMAYDYWGETMNMASRIEGQAEPDGIAISETTFLRTGRKSDFGEPQMVTLKGVGEAPVYRLVRREAPKLVSAA
ncbi:MAG: adenylate/guanylate cyclase domain-containing protein [Erythrobacter sp.]|jgi:class 3 adenylate cyclase|nr:adenylate/guanylate cyclase domain-containing protein [Erythrobacter sp.]